MTYAIIPATKTQQMSVHTAADNKDSCRQPQIPSHAEIFSGSNMQMTSRILTHNPSILIKRFEVKRREAISVKITFGTAFIVAPEYGHVTVLSDDECMTIDPGEIALLARPRQMLIIWSASSVGDIIQVRRDKLQIVASYMFGQPKRLAAIDKRFLLDSNLASAFAALKKSVGVTHPGNFLSSVKIETQFYQALTSIIGQLGCDKELFLDVRAAREAIAYLHSHQEADCTPAALAVVVGVTERTLRERFRQSLGISITTFVQNIRLDWTRNRLSNLHETRSVGELAHVAGFGSGSALSKSYLRRFGESPTQTRARVINASSLY